MNGDDIRHLFERSPWPEPRSDLRGIIMERVYMERRPQAHIIALPVPMMMQEAFHMPSIRLATLGLLLAAGFLAGFLTLDTPNASSAPYFTGTGTMLEQALSL